VSKRGLSKFADVNDGEKVSIMIDILKSIASPARGLAISVIIFFDKCIYSAKTLEYVGVLKRGSALGKSRLKIH